MKNKKLRQTFKDKRCLVCNELGCDPCHIKSYATTLEDSLDNLMPLCRKCHSAQHKVGIATFCLRYESVLNYVSDLGFEVKKVFGVNRLMKK